MKTDPRNTRPGGTISGVAMFVLADFSVYYVAIIGSLGEPDFDARNIELEHLARPEARLWGKIIPYD